MRIVFLFALAASLITADDRKDRARGDERKETSGRSEGRARSGSGMTTITGIIDEADGRWVIASAENVQPIATLRATGFKDTNFGRYVGLKVRLRGKMVEEAGNRIFVVSRLSDIKKIGLTSDSKQPESRSLK